MTHASRGSIRIVVWNCNMALHAKVERLMALGPDIAIIPESARPEIVRSKASGFDFHDASWIGTSAHKGLAVYAFNGLTLRTSPLYHPDFEYFLPVEVTGAIRFKVLAVWAFNHRTKVERLKHEPGTRRAIEHYRPFLSDGRGIVAGDFNANVIWDEPGRADNFSNTVQDLEALGYVSGYHSLHGQNFGQERDPTICWYRDLSKPYHIDYGFVPRAWVPLLRRVTVGVPGDWLGDSDHVPIVIELSDIESNRFR